MKNKFAKFFSGRLKSQLKSIIKHNIVDEDTSYSFDTTYSFDTSQTPRLLSNDEVNDLIFNYFEKINALVVTNKPIKYIVKIADRSLTASTIDIQIGYEGNTKSVTLPAVVAAIEFSLNVGSIVPNVVTIDVKLYGDNSVQYVDAFILKDLVEINNIDYRIFEVQILTNIGRQKAILRPFGHHVPPTR
jgi:hypothetical protein